MSECSPSLFSACIFRRPLGSPQRRLPIKVAQTMALSNDGQNRIAQHAYLGKPVIPSSVFGFGGSLLLSRVTSSSIFFL
jgi:hypothetical protein